MIDKYQLIFFGGNNKSRQNELNFHDGPEIISFLAYVHWSWIDLLSGGGGEVEFNFIKQKIY